MRSFISTLLFFVLLTAASKAQDSLVIPITSFDPANFDESAKDQQWQRLTLPKKDWMEYILITGCDMPHIKAVSNNSASGWKYLIDIDPQEYPIIEWQ